jgi:AhpD family alkylhydroperoxidase
VIDQDANKGATMTAEDTTTKGQSPAPLKPNVQAKRTLTADNIFRTVSDVVASGPVLFEAALRPKISAALREKLFLAVSFINDCRYCKWGHTHWAMAKGVPVEVVNQILGHQMESLVAKNPGEAAAILFAQHYAEQLDPFDPESIEDLRQYYSEAEVAEMLAYVRFITLANLTGNTVDAFLTEAHRLGKAAAASNPRSLQSPRLWHYGLPNWPSSILRSGWNVYYLGNRYESYHR